MTINRLHISVRHPWSGAWWLIWNPVFREHSISRPRISVPGCGRSVRFHP